MADLGDTIYYRQVKEYTDQELESSKDLQKAIRDGRLAILNQEASGRGSIPEGHVAVPVQGINAQDLRRIIREESSSRDSLKDVVPVLVDLIRQEFSGLSRQGSVQQTLTERSTFDPSFAPNVSTEGMKSNINLESREVNSDDVSLALVALRKLQNSK